MSEDHKKQIQSQLKKDVHIKNMVCQRCIDVVLEIFERLNIEITNITLGKVQIKSDLERTIKKKLINELSLRGFELLSNTQIILVNEIKTIIIEFIHYSENISNDKLSEILTQKLNYSYDYLSHKFSEIENKSIERYVILQKVEKVKELLKYNELTLKEIVYQLNYSSISHLCSQFKKETGLTTTQFKTSNTLKRHKLDLI
ncbi:MAG: AraC family transcriptional regulator [Flavobacteriales bacterium]|nr:AraC family transcriptional regulator [Flavobacteriales bacterium]|tara:strand:- start:2666 stop:3268 length:603 start_codon:yes stop_codon:yes gene_type:complete